MLVFSLLCLAVALSGGGCLAYLLLTEAHSLEGY